MGCAVDLDTRKMYFSLEGDFSSPMGEAFSNFTFKGGLRPSATCNYPCQYRFNFGDRGAFKFSPPSSDYKAVAMSVSNDVLLARSFGYRFRVRNYPGLEVRVVEKFEFIWNDEGSPVEQKTSWWRPMCPPGGFVSLADVVVRGYKSPGASLVAKDDGSGILVKPKRFELKWSSEDTNAKSNGSLWWPVAPDGYVTMGLIGTKDFEPPSVDSVRCVHRSAVTATKVRDLIWCDKGSGAMSGISVFASDNELSSAICTQCRSDKTYRGGIKVYRLKGVKPGTTSSIWKQERQVLESPSVKWGTYTLERKLKRCLSFSLCHHSYFHNTHTHTLSLSVCLPSHTYTHTYSSRLTGHTYT